MVSCHLPTEAYSMTLTKNDLVEAIQDQNGLPKNRSREIVETVLDLIKKNLASGEDVLISGFGKFQLCEKKARLGRNPATGDDLMLRSRRVLTFRVSGKIRKRLNR